MTYLCNAPTQDHGRCQRVLTSGVCPHHGTDRYKLRVTGKLEAGKEDYSQAVAIAMQEQGPQYQLRTPHPPWLAAIGTAATNVINAREQGSLSHQADRWDDLKRWIEDTRGPETDNAEIAEWLGVTETDVAVIRNANTGDLERRVSTKTLQTIAENAALPDDLHQQGLEQTGNTCAECGGPLAESDYDFYWEGSDLLPFCFACVRAWEF